MIKVPVVQVVTPPSVLMLPCMQPVFNGRTVNDLLSYVDDLKLNLTDCSLRMASILEWSESVRSEDQK